MRRLLLACLLALVLASSALAAASRDPKDPQLTPRPTDVASARKLLLVKADLPTGFVDKGVDKSSQASPACAPSLHALVQTADVAGHSFERDRGPSFASVSSEGALFRSASEARRAVLIFTGAKMGRCFKSEFQQEMAKKFGAKNVIGLRLTPLRLTLGPLHVDAWDLLVTIKSQGLTLPFEGVFGLYQRGRAVTSLELDSIRGLTQKESAAISKAATLKLLHLSSAAVR